MTVIEHALSAVEDQIELVRNWSPYHLLADAERCADLLASNGIMLWWPERALAQQRRRAGKPLIGCEGVEADPDEAAAALPRALAILSLRQHGVEFDTMHVCDDKHQGECERGQVSFPVAPADGDISARGATFTPRALAETVTIPTLEPLVYEPGPLHVADRQQWKLRSADQIIDKKIGDTAVGCGVFPLAALRYLTDRIAEQVPQTWAFRHVQEIRATLITRCLYGVDIHPGSIAICRLVMALMVPLIDIDHVIYSKFRCGDSLLGITNLDQLRWMHLDPERGKEIHEGVPPIPDELWAKMMQELRGAA